MSRNYHAGQYEDRYKPSKLGNWCATKFIWPGRCCINTENTMKMCCHVPTGLTRFIADDHGHLLPEIKRDTKHSPWGSFVKSTLDEIPFGCYGFTHVSRERKKAEEIVHAPFPKIIQSKKPLQKNREVFRKTPFPPTITPMDESLNFEICKETEKFHRKYKPNGILPLCPVATDQIDYVGIAYPANQLQIQIDFCKNMDKGTESTKAVPPVEELSINKKKNKEKGRNGKRNTQGKPFITSPPSITSDSVLEQSDVDHKENGKKLNQRSKHNKKSANSKSKAQQEMSLNNGKLPLNKSDAKRMSKNVFEETSSSGSANASSLIDFDSSSGLITDLDKSSSSMIR